MPIAAQTGLMSTIDRGATHKALTALSIRRRDGIKAVWLGGASVDKTTNSVA